MGAHFYYDALHAVPPEEYQGETDPHRQVEVFTWAGKLWLRVGPIGDENEGTNRYTAHLTSAQAAKLARAIEDGMVNVAESGA